jgi:hypothetical protein
MPALIIKPFTNIVANYPAENISYGSLIKLLYRVSFIATVSLTLRVTIKKYIYNVASLIIRITGEHFEALHYGAKNIIN